jgi:Ribbon-helix-helix protein, copG family
MRTTLSLDADVASAVSEAARKQGRSRSRVVNDLIRAGLRDSRERVAPERYEAPVFDSGAPLIDVTDVASALEVFEDAR